MRHLPKSLCHLGHVEAAALLVDSSVLGLAEARRRVLSLWRPGADVFEVEPGVFVIRGLRPGRVDTQACPGAPLTWEAGALWALPLSPSERQRVNAPAGAVVFARAGEQVVKPLSPAARVDVSEWLDVSALEVARVKSLSAPARAPATPPPPADVRTALGGDIPPPVPERDAVLAAFSGSGAPSIAPRSSTRHVWRRLMSWLARRTAALLHSLAGARAPPSKALPATSLPQKPRPPGFFSRLAARLDRWAATLANATGVSKIFGKQHARYLRHMLDLFEERDLTEALRHAIPLSSGAGGDSRIAWRPPKPRDELRISPQQAGSGGGLGIGSALFSFLENMYRSASTRLERQGRISEAAFVLAELLQQTEEAISFLECHDKLREAAELAEARDVAPSLLVRQWFVAGDRLRALAAARRTGAYADAMARLERENSEWAYALRVFWADTLARAGDYGAALELIWALPELRERSRELLDKAIAVGGVTAARALVRKVALDPDSFEAVLPSALELLEDDEPERASERLAFASELALATPPAPGSAGAQIIPLRADAPRIPPVREDKAAPLRTLARPALRALVRDGRENPAEIRWELDRLSRAAGEPALVADLPRLTGARASRASRFAPEIRIGAGDAGTRPVLDAARLPGRRFLLALGEAGARIVAADGRLVHHFDLPAHQLAVAENGARAIALAPRGSVHRLSRIDLAERTARFWCEAKLDLWARTYNGERWYAAERDSVFVIDALAEDFKALWHIGDLGGRVLSMAHSAERWSFATAAEVWTVEVPALTLRARTSLKMPPIALQMMDARLAEPRSVVALDPSGRCAFVHAAIDLEPPLPIEPKVPEQLFPSVAVYLGGAAPLISPGMGPSGRPVLSGGFLVVPAGPQLLLVDEATRVILSRVSLERGHWTSVRIDGSALVAADDCGRVVHVDLARAHVVRELRV